MIPAEAALRQEEKKPNYSLELLHIVAAESLPPKTRLAASLAFKNFIRLNYVDEDGNYKLPTEEVVAIKQELVGLMISSPSNIDASAQSSGGWRHSTPAAICSGDSSGWRLTLMMRSVIRCWLICKRSYSRSPHSTLSRSVTCGRCSPFTDEPARKTRSCSSCATSA